MKKLLVWSLIVIFSVLPVYLGFKKLGVLQSLIAHDVSYYFATRETYQSKLPDTIKKPAIVRGKLVERSDAVKCITSPCPPITRRYLMDIHNNRFMVSVDNTFAMQLPLDRIYALSGTLWEKIDHGQQMVFILSFDPVKIWP